MNIIPGWVALGFSEMRLWFRSAVEVIRAEKRLRSVSTDDIDPATRRVFPDYLERRRKRERERRADSESSCVATLGRDVRPD